MTVDPAAKKGKPDSEGGAGFVVGINGSENDDGGSKIESFDVQYVLQKKISREVQPSRVTLKAIQTTS